jgi:ubiquinone/menaquinone biosynthesis C-methylase UbiE
MTDVNDELSQYPIDVESVEEMDRLTKQAQVIAKYTDPHPLQIQPMQGQTILDIGCGPGVWALDLAQSNPDCQIVGLDISQRMVNYANSCAYVRRLPHVRFEQGDARKRLPFPDMSFDIVNARFIFWFLQTTTWLVFLAECYRVLRPGGMLYSTETEGLGITSSSALTDYSLLITHYLRKAQHCFTKKGPYTGITAAQEPLLRKSGFEDIHQHVNVMNYSTGTPAFPAVIEDLAALMPLIEPALLREQIIDQDALVRLRTQVLAEIHGDEFYAIDFFQTVWGRKP